MVGAVLSATLLCCPVGALAQTPTAAPSAAGTVADDPIDPVAMKAMDEMSAALLRLDTIRIDADATTEVVLVTGQKLQFGGTVQIRARRPDAFKIVASSDGQSRELYYDGKRFTIYAPRIGFYASFDAPPSIGLTIDKARRDYGVELPLADLFTWGLDQTFRARVRQAMVVRPETVEGRSCTHYAFRQEAVDWQIWIEAGSNLPCKLVITDTTDPAMPQYVSTLRWTTQTPLSASELAFPPPADAQRITMADVNAALAGGEGQ